MPSTDSQPGPATGAARLIELAQESAAHCETVLHQVGWLAAQPKEPILILGMMEHNSRTIANMLARLPRDRDDYRGNLRVLRGAARELIAYVDGLLGET